MVTAYDEPSARLADAAGAHLLLVGDSVANVVLGRPNTLSVTTAEMAHLDYDDAWDDSDAYGLYIN